MKKTRIVTPVPSLITLFVLMFVFFMYTFLHEAGHAIACLLFGQSITEFDVSFWDLILASQARTPSRILSYTERATTRSRMAAYGRRPCRLARIEWFSPLIQAPVPPPSI